MQIWIRHPKIYIQWCITLPNSSIHFSPPLSPLFCSGGGRRGWSLNTLQIWIQRPEMYIQWCITVPNSSIHFSPSLPSHICSWGGVNLKMHWKFGFSTLKYISNDVVHFKIAQFIFHPLYHPFFAVWRGKSQKTLQIWIQHPKIYIQFCITLLNNSIHFSPPLPPLFFSWGWVNLKIYFKFGFSIPKSVSNDISLFQIAHVIFYPLPFATPFLLLGRGEF